MPVAPETQNPYAPPDTPAGTFPADHRGPGDFFALFVRWEKMRLVYNGVLLLETLILLVGFRGIPVVANLVGVMSILVPAAILANVCFCAGIVANGYLWWIGWRSPAVGRIFFGLGMLLAILLVPVVLFGTIFPGPG